MKIFSKYGSQFSMNRDYNEYKNFCLQQGVISLPYLKGVRFYKPATKHLGNFYDTSQKRMDTIRDIHPCLLHLTKEKHGRLSPFIHKQYDCGRLWRATLELQVIIVYFP